MLDFLHQIGFAFFAADALLMWGASSVISLLDDMQKIAEKAQKKCDEQLDGLGAGSCLATAEIRDAIAGNLSSKIYEHEKQTKVLITDVAWLSSADIFYFIVLVLLVHLSDFACLKESITWNGTWLFIMAVILLLLRGVLAFRVVGVRRNTKKFNESVNDLKFGFSEKVKFHLAVTNGMKQGSSL
jgi:hypothetical protein